jgi:hypothetical protein
MITRIVTLSALLLLPSIIDAQAVQRTNRGTKIMGDWNKTDTAMGRAAPSFKKQDIEKFSAVLLVIDKKKDLKLSEEQVGKLKELGKTEEAHNEPLYVRMDSLRLSLRRRPGEDGDKERIRMSLAQQDLIAVIEQIRSNYDSTYKASGLPLLSEAQRTSAEPLLEKGRDEAEDHLRSKLGGGRRGGN